MKKVKNMKRTGNTNGGKAKGQKHNVNYMKKI